MAKILGKDQATYAKERDVFLRDLQHFHEHRGTPIKLTPIIGGTTVDLYLLYNLVTSQGGWLRANSKNAWPDILPLLKIPKSCVNGNVALKQIYLRYLDRWEKVNFLHEDADRASDDDEESRHKRWSARSLHSIPCCYNYAQHNISEAQRIAHQLATNVHKPSAYDRLFMSLLCPLPNEQDFAINVCTLLSNDGKHTLKLEKQPKLVNYLLAHAGVFSHSSLRQLFTHFYNKIRKRPIHNFWKEVLDSPDFLVLTNEAKFPNESESKKSTPLIVGKEDEYVSAFLALNGSNEVQSNDNADTLDCEIIDDNCDNFKLKINAEDGEMFNIKRSLGTQDYIGQRVLQIATILRNLSFVDDNVPVLAKNTSYVRFLLLCSMSRWNMLKNIGLDMLSNIASEFVIKDIQNDLLASKLIKIVTRGLKSEDRAECLSSLEVLNKLSQNEQNEDIMQRSLQAHVYKSVCSFLTLHDVMLLIYTLECLYSLSSLGERSCNFIIVNHGVIDTLVSLVTVEGKSYGPKACIGMKLVETLPSGTSQQAQVTNATASQQPIQQHQQQIPAASSSSTLVHTLTSTCVVVNSSSAATPVATSTTTTIISSSPATKLSAPSTPVRQVNIAPQRLIPISPTTTTSSMSTLPSTPSVIQTSTVMTPQQLIQQQHAHQQAIHENEQFALAWLRATYEPCTSGKIDHQELYKHYLSSCSNIGRRGVISPLHFPRCVRSVFGGTVGPNPMKPANPTDPQYYEGIKVRDKPLIINIPPSSVTKPVGTTTVPAASSNSVTKLQQVRRKSVQPVSGAQTVTLTVVADNNNGVATDVVTASSPASPILKAQLSAPPKQREGGAPSPSPSTVSSKGDVKSQAMAHPHLSQALLGSTASTAPSTSTVTVAGGALKDNQGQTSNTSLIKSLLATKVNDCMSTVSMRTATDCQNVAQVAARQRLLAQQNQQQSSENLNKTPMKETANSNRLNGVRQLFSDIEIGDPSVSSTTQFSDLTKGKKEPPQPPPPPLAPLSNNVKGGGNRSQRIDNEDSDSIGNNSLASSSGIGTIGIGGVSSTDDGENSLTGFEGLLNGIPAIENALNDDSDSKDFVKISSSEISVNKPLRLADLLEKKFEKSPPMLNGALGKELRLGDKAMDLVENHIEKALSREIEANAEKCIKMEVDFKNEPPEREMVSLKRCSSDDIMETETKRPLLASNVNGTLAAHSPAPDSSSSNGDDGPSTGVSNAAAKLFADIAADILEDEDEEQLLQDVQTQGDPPAQQVQLQAAQQNPLQQIIVDQNNQQVLLTQPRQIIVSSGGQLPNANQMVLSGTPVKTQAGQTVIVQNASGQRSMMLAQPNAAGQILLSQGIQGQMQIVASQSGQQYVLQTTGGNGQGAAYVVAQPQNAVMHNAQPQTVLLAQTPQQQGTGAKTIIILQQQPSAGGGGATQHQKVMVTPQGQQVVVTQVPRPVMHTSSVSNNVSPVTKAIKSVSTGNTNTSTTQTQNTSIVISDRREDVRRRTRDLTSPFVCEWNDCTIDVAFKSANEVYLHACASHCPTGSEEIICQWDRCDNMKRKRFSLMTHLHDKHCNTESMKQSLAKRKQAAQSNKPESPAPATPSPHPGYAPDAALHAIKRHALEFVNPKELQDENEGPVTKSIRLTASLILRNLVIYSSHCKRYLKSYESHLANVALSNVESSRTIAQILFDMNDSTHR